MLVSISGWESTGLRCPDTKVSFLKGGNPCGINLVQMPNGTGKSTIIELISAALTNSASNWDTRKIREFRSKLQESDSGQFILTLLLNDSDQELNKKVVFQMDFDFVSGTVNLSTLNDSTVGLEIGWRVPRELTAFLNSKCVEVFVFKGDKVQNLIEYGRDDAESSIKHFFGLSHVDEIHEIVEKDFMSRQEGVKTDRGQARLQGVLNKWVEWHKELERTKHDYEEKLIPLRSSYDDLRARVSDIMDGMIQNKSQLAEYEADRDKAKEQLSSGSQTAFAAIQNPFFISQNINSSMTSLKRNLDKMKLPGTSGEFFKEIAEDDACICGRTFDQQSRDYLLENSQSYLSDNHIAIINGIKSDIDNHSYLAVEQEKEKPFEKLTMLQGDYYLKDERVTRQKTLMRDESTPMQQLLIDELQDVASQKDDLEKRLKHIQNEDGDIRTMGRGSYQDCKKIPLVKKIIKAKQEELAQINDTVQEFNAKEKFKRILLLASESTLEKLKVELCAQSNSKLKTILPEGTPLEILEIKEHIQLGFNGKKQHLGSGGQNVSVAYSFATSLLERSGVQFPLIVDHPVTALQESARRGLGQKLSSICHQFIGFIIDTEKAGFVDSLNPVDEQTTYITLFRNIPGNQHFIDLLPDDNQLVFKSENAYVCTDKNFFKNFHDVESDLSE